MDPTNITFTPVEGSMNSRICFFVFLFNLSSSCSIVDIVDAKELVVLLLNNKERREMPCNKEPLVR